MAGEFNRFNIKFNFVSIDVEYSVLTINFWFIPGQAAPSVAWFRLFSLNSYEQL